MKRILYIAYFFPPLGGAGVQRTAKFVRYLPEHGFQPTVLTARSSYWMRDESLLAEIPAGTRVERAPHWFGRWTHRAAGGGTRSAARVSILRGVARFFFVPDAYLGWILPAARRALALLRETPHDLILSTSSPDSSHLLGQWLKRRTGLPWVADFRDPWTERLSYAPPTPAHDALQRRLERDCLLDADLVLVTSDATRDHFLATHPSLSPERVLTLTNGYDEQDFTDANAWLATAPPDLVRLWSGALLHAGQLNPDRPLGPLLVGLRRLLARGGEAAARAEVVFLGGHYDRDVAEVAAAGLEGRVTFMANRPHVESIAACLSARGLLLMEQNSPRGALVLPGKTFELARTGKSILALVPPGGAADVFLRDSGAGLAVDPSSPETVADALARVFSDPPPPGAAPERLLPYERRALTSRLASRLRSLLEDSR